MLTTATSTTLLQGLRNQDNDAWRQLYARYRLTLLSFARRAGLGEQDADDVVQNTLTAFLESFRDGRYDRRRGRLRSWLKGIVINKVRETRRRLARPEVQVVDETNATAFLNRVPDHHALEDAFDAEWEQGVLEECLREVRRLVDPLTFQAFELYAMKDWPPEQVAKHLGVSRNAVYISKSRVLSRLRELQEEMTEIW